MNAQRRTVLHVIAYETSRGAETHAQALVAALNSSTNDDHSLVSLFVGDGFDMDVEHRIDVPRGPLRRLGIDPRVVFGLRRLIGRLQPDLVVGHGGEPAKYLSLVPDAAYVYLMIGSAHPRLSNPLRRILRKRYLERSRKVVAVSRDLEEELSHLQIPGLDVDVILNGRDPEIYKPAQQGPSTERMIFVGSMEPQKRPELFIDVVAQLRDEGLDVEALMVGGGPLLAQVEGSAASLDIQVLGPRSDVPDLLRDSAMLVSTSRPPEGLPGVLVEAGLSGIPAVTTIVPGAAEVIVSGETGLLVEDAELVGAVRGLISDPARRAEMGKAARAHCVERFSMEVEAGAWARVIDEVTT